MEIQQLVSIALRLVSGSTATFFAIMLWRKTREIQWVGIILGVCLIYCNIIFLSLSQLGVISDRMSTVGGFLHVSVLLESLSLVCFTLSMTWAYFRHKL